MKYYKKFMSRQGMSPETHQRLLDLGEGRKQPSSTRKPDANRSERPSPAWAWAASIAAVLALVMGVVLYQTGPKSGAPVAENPASTPYQNWDVEGDALGQTIQDKEQELHASQTESPTTTPVPSPVDVRDDSATHSNTTASEDAEATTFQAKGPEDLEYAATWVMQPDASTLPSVSFPKGLSWSVYAVDYADLTDTPLTVGCTVLRDGFFQVDLTKADIQALFWGAEGKPAVPEGASDPGDFPFGLYAWAGYDVSASVIYDGEGSLWQLIVRGVRGEDSFTLEAAPGHLPPTSVAADGGAETEINGVTVTAWRQEYDRDGDGVNEHICTSEFMVGDVGVRFENTGAGTLKSNADEKEYSGDAILFNELVVTQLVKDGLYIDHIAQHADVPDWRTESFDTLSQALSEADFAPYLPQTAPEGFGNFNGNLDYQEGTHHRLAVRWYKNYDSVEVTVSLPEGKVDPIFEEDIVDVNVPESYDWRLYDGAICDVVPEQYQDAFYMPVFKAEDMSLEVVKARMTGKDTGGQSCNFYVLHENGVAVGYTCSAVTADYVWGLVEDTLPAQAITMPVIQSTPIITHHPEPEGHHSNHHG